MPKARTPVVAVVPGSFDPITYGHVDIIERAAGLYDRVVVGVLLNESKEGLFRPDERVAMIRRIVGRNRRIEVRAFDGLLVRFARECGARVIVRGIRAVSDYEYELQMALMNRRLEPGIDTVFLLPKEEYSFLSSRLVKEVCRLGGDVTGLVPPAVLTALKSRLRDGAATPKKRQSPAR